MALILPSFNLHQASTSTDPVRFNDGVTDWQRQCGEQRVVTLGDGENVLIRSPQPADEQAWRALWSGYNSFYGASVPEAATDVLWQRIVSDADAVFARLAVDAHGLAGFAICVLHPFTWGTQPVCLLEDLYVDPARRGVGVGRKLLDSLRKEAARESWARLYWHTREDNATARRLYDSYVSADGFVRYTLAFDGAVATAGGSEPTSRHVSEA